MISFFPSVYSDELLYSQLARFYVKSGYTAYTFAAEELYKNKTVKPNIEFLNAFTDDALKLITGNSTIDDLIMNHTMFPYYGRFIDHERRQKAYNSLLSMNNDYCNYLYFPKNKDGSVRYLRYCPLCVSADRELYGETYWHRIHQLIGVNICPLHHCILHNSAIAVNSKSAPALISAEESAGMADIYISENTIECKIAQYVSEVFLSPINLNSCIKIGEFLHSEMEETEYLSLRGEQRNISKLQEDFLDFYKDLKTNTLTDIWQMQKIFNSKRVGTFEICLLAVFLGISVEDLVNSKSLSNSQAQRFDEKIRIMHQQGLKYPEIARQLGASYDVVKAIGEERYKPQQSVLSVKNNGGAKKKDWVKIDAEKLPLVKEIIKSLQQPDERPVHITAGMIERILNMPKKSLANCPQCRTEIARHIKSQEDYWASEVAWAVKRLIREGKPIHMTNIFRLTNMRPQNVEVCLPHLEKYMDEAMVEKIKGMYTD